MNRLKQRSTLLGISTIVSVLFSLATGTVTVDIAAPAITSGLGLIFADA